MPTFSVYEVFSRVLQQRDEGDALQATAAMIQRTVAELTLELALDAARISSDPQLPMTDSMILATGRQYKAVLWTQDADFERVDGVQYVEKL